MDKLDYIVLSAFTKMFFSRRVYRCRKNLRTKLITWAGSRQEQTKTVRQEKKTGICRNGKTPESKTVFMGSPFYRHQACTGTPWKQFLCVVRGLLQGVPVFRFRGPRFTEYPGSGGATGGKGGSFATPNIILAPPVCPPVNMKIAKYPFFSPF